jgi:SAM-dependent methyltransferase
MISGTSSGTRQDIVVPDRPAHLTQHNAAAFQLASVVDAYHLRTPYPPELAPFLLGLMPTRGAVLELGCGTGEITRALAPLVERIDAIDVSEPMLARARAMPGGDHPAIRWIAERAEDASLDGPYALAVSGDALHWMDWDVVLPRLIRALATGAVLAIVTAVMSPPPWSDALRPVIARYSVMQDFQPYEIGAELVRRGLFQRHGEETVGSMPFRRTVAEYVDALHATAGMPRERMRDDDSRAFDEAVASIVGGYGEQGTLQFEASARVIWGAPLDPHGSRAG